MRTRINAPLAARAETSSDHVDKIRIIFAGPFDPTLCDGVSSSVFDLSTFLRSQGHEVLIVSFVESSPLTRRMLNHLHESQTEPISSDRDHFHYVWHGINVHFALVPFTAHDVLNCHPGVLERYITKLSEYKGSYFFTADDDFTCLLVRSILKSKGAHVIHSPDRFIRRLNSMPIFKRVLGSGTIFTVSNFSRGELQKELGR